MGPSIILDKSTFQSLNPDEALWLDNFFIVNITPLFFVETLADLEKEVKHGRTPEQVVGSLAYKTPDMSSCVNSHHQNLIYGELSANAKVEMSGRPLVSGGQTVVLGNESGVIFQESQEAEAFKRWQKGQFLEIERLIAKKWRAGLNNSNFEEISTQLSPFFKIFGTPKSLQDLKTHVDLIINTFDQNESLVFALSMLGISQSSQSDILGRWESEGKKPIKEFAPYSTYVLSIDLFFYLGVAANLFTAFRHHQTHNVDIAYLYYLPFCNIFVSNDKFHSAVTPFFLRENQTFVNGLDFKADLTKVDNYYSSLPDKVKDRGVVSFAFIPPADAAFLVSSLWDKYMSPTWRTIKSKKFDGSDKIDPEMEKSALERIRKFVKESTPSDSDLSGDDVKQMVVKHMVLKRKGKWRRFPPEIENSKPVF